MLSGLQKHTLILIIIFPLLSVAISGLVIYPTVSAIIKAEHETYQLRVYLEKKHEQALRSRLSLKKVGLIKSTAARYSRYLFTHGEELAFITLLENTAAQNGVEQKITNSNLDQITNQQLTLRLDLTGPYHKILNYLVDLEKLDYFLSVRQLRLTPAANQQNKNNNDTNPQVILSLDIALYVSQ